MKNADVKKYFGCFGKVKDVKLMPNKSGHGMGYVVFTSQESVSKVLEHSETHTITGVEVSSNLNRLLITIDQRESLASHRAAKSGY